MITYANNHGYHYTSTKATVSHFSRGILNRYNVSKPISGFGMASLISRSHNQ